MYVTMIIVTYIWVWVRDNCELTFQRFSRGGSRGGGGGVGHRGHVPSLPFI